MGKVSGIFRRLRKAMGWMYLSPKDWDDTEWAAMYRWRLLNRCPLCGRRLRGHGIGIVAVLKIDGVAISDDEDGTEALINWDVGDLPLTVNYDEKDVLWYNILICPQLNDNVIIEQYDSYDYCGPGGMTPLLGISKARRSVLKDRCSHWIAL